MHKNSFLVLCKSTKCIFVFAFIFAIIILPSTNIDNSRES